MAFSAWGGEHVFVHGLKGGLKGLERDFKTFIFFVFNPLERLCVAFSFLWSGKHVFCSFLRLEKAVSFKGALKGLEGGLKGGL